MGGAVQSLQLAYSQSLASAGSLEATVQNFTSAIAGASKHFRDQLGTDDIQIVQFLSRKRDELHALQLLERRTVEDCAAVRLHEEIGKTVGSGRAASVHRAEHGVGVEIAVKQFFTEATESPERRKRLFNEILMLHLSQSHEHIIRLLHFSVCSATLGHKDCCLGGFLSMPYVKRSLWDLFKLHRSSKKSETDIKLTDWFKHRATKLKALRQIADANSWLFQRGIHHNDIKADNCLVYVDEYGTDVKVCLADFGFASLD